MCIVTVKALPSGIIQEDAGTVENEVPPIANGGLGEERSRP